MKLHGVTFTSKSNIYHDIRHKQKYIYLMRYLPTLGRKLVNYNTSSINKYSPVFSIATTKRSMSQLKTITPRTNSATKFENLIQRSFSKKNNFRRISVSGPHRGNNTGRKVTGLDVTKIYEVQKFIYYLCYTAMEKIDKQASTREIKEDLYYLIFTFIHENELLFFLNRTLVPDKYNADPTNKYQYFAMQIQILLNKTPVLKSAIVSQFLECQKIGLSYMLYGSRIIKILMDIRIREIIKLACIETNKKYKEEWPANHMIGNGAHPRFFTMDYYFNLIDNLFEVFDSCGFYMEELDPLIDYYDISKYEYDTIFSNNMQTKGMSGRTSSRINKKSRARGLPK